MRSPEGGKPGGEGQALGHGLPGRDSSCKSSAQFLENTFALQSIEPPFFGSPFDSLQLKIFPIVFLPGQIA